MSFGDHYRAMCAWVRYLFHVDPYSMDHDDFVKVWREAEYLIPIIIPQKKKNEQDV